jgi:hypothetical protein
MAYTFRVGTAWFAANHAAIYGMKPGKCRFAATAKLQFRSNLHVNAETLVAVRPPG